MRILVTGGAGLVGSHTAEYFASQGHEVVVLDSLLRSRLFGYEKQSVEYTWQHLGSLQGVTRIVGDVRNEADVVRAIGDGVDVVIHAAGQPGVPLSVRIPREDFSINAFGTLNVLDCARQRAPRATFIYCSTNKVYGENVDQIPLREEATRFVYEGVPGVPETMSIDHTGHTPYGASKYVGDLYTQEYASIYGMRTGVFRMSCIAGTRQFGFEDQGWVAWFTIAVLYGRPLTLFGNGKQVRDILYVTDLVKAYEAFIRSDLRHGVFNVGGGPERTTSLLEFLEYLQQRMRKKAKVTFEAWRPSDQKVYISDLRKIQRELGWQPQVSVHETADRILAWVQGHPEMF